MLRDEEVRALTLIVFHDLVPLTDNLVSDDVLWLQNLLEALVWLMRCGDHALTCQGSALKYLPHAVPHMIKIYPDTQLT